MIKKNIASFLAKNKSFCSMAWNHQFLDPTGRVKPCCRFEETHRPKNNHLNNDSLQNLFNGPWMNKVREKMISGEDVDGCTRCYQEELAGKKSLRQRQNDNLTIPIDKYVDIQQPKIQWLELAISNACNLACRMCDSRYSLKWFEEEKEIYGKTINPVKISKTKIDEVLPFLQDLVHIKFTGGEPLITKEHWVLIDKLLEEQNCNDIFLNYSTNCTIYPKDSWVKKWDNFKHIEFALSFDSANKLEAEYIRWPETYETIEKTTKAFLKLEKKDHYIIMLRTTVSLLNIWSLPETMLWWLNQDPIKEIKINPTHLTHPAFLSITVLPIHIKKRIAKKFNAYISENHHDQVTNILEYMKNYMFSTDHSHHLPYLKDYLEKTDSYRNQNFYHYYPHFNDIFDNLTVKKNISSFFKK